MSSVPYDSFCNHEAIPWQIRLCLLDHQTLSVLTLHQLLCPAWLPARPAWQARRAPAQRGMSHLHKLLLERIISSEDPAPCSDMLRVGLNNGNMPGLRLT